MVKSYPLQLFLIKSDDSVAYLFRNLLKSAQFLLNFGWKRWQKMSVKIFFLLLVLFGVNCVDIPSDYCTGLNGVMLPHPDPTRCTEFVLCLFGNPIVRQCLRLNEIFYPPAQDCVLGLTILLMSHVLKIYFKPTIFGLLFQRWSK